MICARISVVILLGLILPAGDVCVTVTVVTTGGVGRSKLLCAPANPAIDNAASMALLFVKQRKGAVGLLKMLVRMDIPVVLGKLPEMRLLSYGLNMPPI